MHFSFKSNKHLYIIPCVILLGIISISILAWISVKPTYMKNGFTRNFLFTQPTVLSISKNREDISDIAGYSKESIFLKTRTPGKIISVSYNLDYRGILTIDVPKELNMSSVFSCTVDSPFIHIMAGNMPGVLVGEINKPTKIYKLKSSTFTRCVNISPSTYIFRGFDSSFKGDQIFIKRNLQTGEVNLEKNLIEHNFDAGISSDGFLSYDNSAHLLSYIFFYKNKFLCIDTNLRLLYSGHTIDTTNATKTQVGNVNNIVTNTTPERIINGRSITVGGKLYNISKLKADNEEDEIFSKSSVVDIYNLKSGNYESSFHIPFYNGEKMISFMIVGDKLLLSIYKSNLILYKL